jgi:peptidyl-prolyl cis-trans isomerase C
VKFQNATALLVLAALLAAPLALAQDAPKAKSSSKAKQTEKAAASTEIYSQALFDMMMKEALKHGQQDTPQLRARIADELTNRELFAREAKKKGMDKDPAMKMQMELAAQNMLLRSFVEDYLKAHPASEEELKKDYEAAKTRMGDKEYKVRHILVEKEDEAKEIITQLQKGEKFEKLAERSKDEGSKAKGGDLDWNGPANFVKPFSDAMVALEKGKFTPKPVQSQFGWHVIQLDDVRAAKVPGFDEVKGQLQQQAQGRILDQLVKDLRTKAGLK